MTDFAQRLEKRRLANSVVKKGLFNYTSPASIWQEHRESTRGRDLDITGLTYDLLDKSPQQWPFKEGQTQGQARLYEDATFPTPDGRARFVNARYKPVAEPRESRFPFSLTTGRLRDQWHGMSRTGTLGRLFGHVSEPVLQMNPQDMARRLLKEGDLVHVTSKRGSILVPVQASTELGMSQVFMAMHWGEEFLSGSSANGQRLAGVNALTTSAFCQDSKQPEFKHAAVKVLKAEATWSLLAMAWLPASLVVSARIELQKLMAQFDFASCVPFSDNSPLEALQQERQGLLFRASHFETPAGVILEKIERLLNLDNPYVIRYADKKRGQRRAALLQRHENQTTLEGVMLAGDTSAQAWITTLLKDALPAQAYGRALLLPGAKPPVPVVSRGQPVCACFNVTDSAIATHLSQCQGSDAERLRSLQATLKCGTNCGSCVPQLQRMVKASTALSTMGK